jgi:hypothetical protein
MPYTGLENLGFAMAGFDGKSLTVKHERTGEPFRMQ